MNDARGKGLSYTPDAADFCIAMLKRSAEDGTLLTLYPVLFQGKPAANEDFSQMGTPAELQAKWSPVVQEVVTEASKGGKILPSLAFDAGFTSAYTGEADANDVIAGAPDNWKNRSGELDPDKLKQALADVLPVQPSAQRYSPDLVKRAVLLGRIYGALHFTQRQFVN